MAWTRRTLLGAVPFLSTTAWLKLAEAAGPRRFVDMKDLRDTVIEILRHKPGVTSVVPDAADPAKISVRAGKGVLAVDLTNLFQRMRAYPNDDAEKMVLQFTAALFDVQHQPVSNDSLVAVLRDRPYVEQIRKVKGGLLTEPFAGELMIVYMADLPGSMSTVAASEFPKGLVEARRVALRNVRKWLDRVKSDNRLRVTTLYVVEGNTFLSPTLILLDEFWTSIKDRYPGDVLIIMPRRDQLFIFDDTTDGPALARRMIEVTFKEGFNLLSDQIYARRHGKIVAL
jgi:uncharacterized protein YtpQ (UPF0354 family)